MRRILNLFRSKRDRMEQDLSRELRYHVDRRVEDVMRSGMSEADARRRVAIEFGGVAQVQEQVRDTWVWRWHDDRLRDLRYAARTLARAPGFTATAVMSLALGIGLNTGIFSVVNSIALRDLPAPHADELVAVHQMLDGVPERLDKGGRENPRFSTLEYRTYRDDTETLSGIMGYTSSNRATLGGDAPQVIYGTLVTCSYFDVLQQPPALGRDLIADDCAAGAAPVVMLGHELWATTYAKDPAIVGGTVVLNRHVFTVIGVAPENAYGPDLLKAAFFVPISAQAALYPTARLSAEQGSWLTLIGRRNAHSSLEQVRVELNVIAAHIDRQLPGSRTVLVERAAVLSTEPRAGNLGAVVGVMIPTGLILLIACANVANLLLARATARRREIALRLSLGASRARVMHQLVTESVLLAIAGGLLGSMLAFWSFEGLVAFVLSSWPVEAPPIAIDLSLDLRVLSFALALSLGTGVLFGLAPALRISRPDLNAMMKRDSTSVVRRPGGRLQAALVGVQVTASMMLMIGSGLFLQGLYVSRTDDLGFDHRDVAVASFDRSLGNLGYGAEEAAVFQRRLAERVGELPTVETVAYAWREPLAYDGGGFMVARLPGQDPSQYQRVERNHVSAGYFSVVGIPIVRGRTFAETDLADTSSAVIVTETTARRLWPEQDPIGRTLLRRVGAGQEAALQVVGVVKDAQVTRVGEIDSYYAYFPPLRRNQNQLKLLVGGQASFASTASGIRAVVHELDADLPVRVTSLEANLAFWRDLFSLVTTLAASLGVLALVLAAVGIYGVVSYVVSLRTREIGIRLALGANSRGVLGAILRRTMRPVVIGALIGIAGAAASSSILSSVTFGMIPAVDPIGVCGAALFVLGVAFAASLLPARRGLGVDPMTTLRYE
jgi:predicted permease